MKTLMKILVAGAISMGLSGPSLAELGWTSCDVKRIGPVQSAGVVYVELYCSSYHSPGTTTWHPLHSDIENQGMATVLTAMSMGKRVTVNVDLAQNYSDIYAVYLRIE